MPRSFYPSAFSILPLLTACVGQSAQCPCSENPGQQAASGSAAGTAADSSPLLAGCDGEAVPAADGLVDDFEDDNSQMVKLDGRDGYWWKHADPAGSKFSDPPEGSGLKFTEGAGSAKGLHVAGVTGAGKDAYGIELGTNLLSAKGETYDGSKYMGLSFKAKVGPKSSKKVRFNLADVNTHQDPGVCKSCWNHFRKDFTFTTEWQEYKASFAELKQRDGWGEPRPKSITPAKLYGLSFVMDGGGDFELFVDDVQFLECKK